MQQPTHIRGRLIDHAYILNPENDQDIFTKRYSPYYTDHDVICIILRNKKKTEAKQYEANELNIQSGRK